jgi:ABC-type phosphate transport system ATPase subunit
MMANETDPAPAPVVKLQRRSPVDRLRYLASKLFEGDEHRLSVAIALEAMADEIALADEP